MKVYLIDNNPRMVESWEKVFKNEQNIEIHCASIFDYSADAIVSPANSLGFMNGGIDFAISKNLGWHIEKKLQKIIREKYFGELLIGQAEIIDTDNTQFPYLISAPTMRTPMTILHTPNVYLAMKAILTLVKYGKFENGKTIHQTIKTIAISGLGTGIGQVPPITSAIQMKIAWEDVMQEKFKTLEGWEELRANYAYFFTSRTEDLKRGSI